MEEEEREAKTSKADGNIFTAAREITFGDANQPSLKERQAIKKEKEALKTAADKIVVEGKIADPSISQVKNEWTESLNSRLATLVRELKFDFEAVAKKISVEV